MTEPRWNDPADEARNPHRAEERRHARDELESRLRDRSITLSGDETDEELLHIVNAVEAFEARRARIGGDSFVNTRDSSEPDDERFVLPARRHDESPARYTARVLAAAARLA
jgi:hypothetical protein